MGRANDPPFQRDVLIRALELLEASSGPVLADYPHDAGGDSFDTEPLACPVNFSIASSPTTEQELLFRNFRAEAATMTTWYDLAREKTNRTTAGISGLAPLQIVDLFGDFLANGGEQNAVTGQKLSDQLRMAAEDIRAYYLEAVAVQPGQSTSPAVLADWFWGETSAARVINEVRKACLGMAAKDMRLTGKLLLIPRNQMHRFLDSAAGR